MNVTIISASKMSTKTQTMPTPLWYLRIIMPLALIVLSLTSSPAFAQQSLETFLRHAKEYNFDNREAQTLVKQRMHEATQAWAHLLPSLSIQADYIRNQYLGAADIPTGEPATGGILPTRQVIITPSDQRDVSLSATLPLVNFSTWADIGTATANRDAQQARLAATELDVEKTVAQTYYQFVGAREVARAARRTLTAAEDNVRYIDTRAKAGLALDLDSKRALAEVERDRQAIEDADYSVTTLRRSLETLTGIRVEEDSTSIPLEFPKDTLYNDTTLNNWLQSLDTLPSVQAALYDQHAANHTASSSEAALYPSLSLQFAETFTNATGFGESPYYSVKLLASWKIDFSSSKSADAQKAAAEASTVRYERERSAVADALFNDWQSVRTQIAKSRAAGSSLIASRSALAVAREKYGSGKATFLEVVQAERDAFSAEVTDIQAHEDLASAWAILRLSAGQSLVKP